MYKPIGAGITLPYVWEVEHRTGPLMTVVMLPGWANLKILPRSDFMAKCQN